MKKIAVLHYGIHGYIEIFEMLDIDFEEMEKEIESLAPTSREDWEWIYDFIRRKGRKIETVYPDFSLAFEEEE